jgi:5-amino-6-(5-phosphoribosylamino)uracil reductase
LALVTRRGVLDPDADYLGGPARPVVITCESGQARLGSISERADLIVVGSDDVDLPAAMVELEQRGHRRILSEGGPHLLGSLLDAGLVDEMVTTVSPLVVGGDSGRMVARAGTALRELSLVGVLEQDGALFMRYRRKGQDS